MVPEYRTIKRAVVSKSPRMLAVPLNQCLSESGSDLFYGVSGGFVKRGMRQAIQTPNMAMPK